MDQKGSANVAVLVILAVVIIGIGGYFALSQEALAPDSVATANPTPVENSTSTPASEPKNNILSVSLGEQFTLKKGQVAKIADTGLEIEITEFFNSPCPPGAQCIWSGVGTQLEYRLNGEVQKGVDLVEVFGYHTTIVKTDHETYADLVVEKMK